MNDEDFIWDEREELYRGILLTVNEALEIVVDRGVSIGASLTGLWQVTMNMIVDMVEDKNEIIPFLLEKIEEIKNYGDNVDANPVALDDVALKRKIVEVMETADTILKLVNDKMEKEDFESKENILPEIMFDITINKIQEAWGPTYLRKALAAQIDVFSEAEYVCIMPEEPEIYTSKYYSKQEGIRNFSEENKRRIKIGIYSNINQKNKKDLYCIIIIMESKNRSEIREIVSCVKDNLSSDIKEEFEEYIREGDEVLVYSPFEDVISDIKEVYIDEKILVRFLYVQPGGGNALVDRAMKILSKKIMLEE